MKVPVFTGSCTAIVTPFGRSGIDFGRFGELIDFQINGGTAAIVVCGTTGEASTLSENERMEAVDFCVSRVAGRMAVIAGTGTNDTAETVRLSRAAERLGADAVLAVTPYYNKTTQEGLIRHYGAVADAVNVPLILYSVPSRTGMDVDTGTYATLSEHPNINGVKEASGSIQKVAAISAACGDELNIWTGCDELTVPAILFGARGVISVASNIIPDVMARMAHLALGGDFKSAAALQLKYRRFIESLFCEVNPIPIKAAMALSGIDAGEPRPPLVPMSDTGMSRLVGAMRENGLL